MVLGVPRSGTSLVARILHVLGVNMGKEFVSLPPGWQPDPGHAWSDAEMREVHDVLIGANPFRRGMKVEEQHLERYRQVVGSRSGMWGVKCDLLPFVWDHFAAAVEGEVRMIRTTRCPDASIKSYAARMGWDYSQARNNLEPWFDAVSEVFGEFQGPKHEVAFSRLVDDPEQEVGRLAEFAGVPLKPEAVAAVKPEWKRF